jgi:hypothetical protein
MRFAGTSDGTFFMLRGVGNKIKAMGAPKHQGRGNLDIEH